jgi:hypothetical protein
MDMRLLKINKKIIPTYAEKLQAYCHEFSEFNSRCEQLCNAFDAIATHHDRISSYAVRGMKQNALWLKRRMKEMEHKLEALCAEAYEKNRIGCKASNGLNSCWCNGRSDDSD